MRITKVRSATPLQSFSRALLTSLLGGRKYGADGKPLEKWTGDDVEGKRREKEEASEIFKGYWRRCTSHEKYLELKEEWMKAKKEYEKQGSKSRTAAS